MIASTRVGIPIMGNKSWIGGISYMENLVKAVTSLPEGEKPGLFLVVFRQTLPGLEMHRHILPYFDGMICVGCHPEGHARARYVNSPDELFQWIDLFYPVLSDAWPGVTAVSWIPDFQHIHLPHFFSAEERQRRSQAYARVAAQARMAVFSSRDAQRDFKKLFPGSQVPTRTLPFYVLPADEWYQGDPVSIQRQYGLPDRFFICCNQFWTHKNHAGLFEAIAAHHHQGQDIHLACTGFTEDYRDANHFPSLVRFLKEQNIENLIHILGNIPRDHQIQLIRRALGVIQPSLFEGWSTVVEDCRALGKVMILSDLAVHLEQAPAKAVFFDRQNSRALADAIEAASRTLVPGPARVQEALARQAAKDLVGHFARQFCAIVMDAVASCPPLHAQVMSRTGQSTQDSRFSAADDETVTAYRKIGPLIGSGKHREAMAAIEGFLREYPDYAPGHNDLGVLAYNQGEKEKALHHYEEAVRLSPDHINYLKDLSDYCYVEQGDLERAMNGYNRILAIRPDHVETLLAIGQLCIQIEKLEMSREFYRRALDADPGNEHAREALRMLTGIIGPEGDDRGGGVSADPDLCADTGNEVELLVRKDDPAKAYRVSALVSTFNSERFLRGCLDDLEAQTIADQVEIIVIDSASEQNERAIVEAFQQEYDNIVYVRTQKRETLYAAWNRAIRMARGTYVTNTNTDDRRLPNALDMEAKALDQFPEVGLVYADIWGTKIENDLLRPEDTERFRLYIYSDFSRLNGLTGSNFSPQPMWRRAVHDSVGYFDETYKIAGDYEFFYRVARHFNALHIKSPLGLYLENPGGIEKSQPQLTREEFRRLRQKFYGEMSLEDFFPFLAHYPFDVEACGTACFELGNNCMIASVRPEFDLAIGYYQKARDMLGELPQLLHNLAMAHLGVGDLKSALFWLKKAAPKWSASRKALKELEKGDPAGLSEGARALFFPDHPVVKEARQGKGITPAEITGMPADTGRPPQGDEAAREGTETAKNGFTTLVVMPDQGDNLVKCLTAIRENTPEPHEVLVVDSLQSRDLQRIKKRLSGTKVKWLDHRKGDVPVDLVNRAMSEARGGNIVLIREAVAVTSDWLPGMVAHLDRQPGAGLVGPMMTNIRGRQGVRFHADAGEALASCAGNHREQNRYRSVRSRYLSDGCLLFRKECLGKTGCLDRKLNGAEAFDDFALRFELSGYRNLIAADVCIGHSGPEPGPDHREGALRQDAGPSWLSCLSPELKERLAVLKATELADDLYQRGKMDQAISTLIDCIKVTPEAREIYFEMARMFIEAKRFAEARDVVANLPAGAMNDLRGLEMTGYAREGLDLDAEADACADGMLAIDEKSPAALNLKGVLAYKQGDREGAGNYFKKAMTSDPGYAESHTNYGVLNWADGQREEAYGYLRKGFILAPTVPDHGKLYYAAVTALETFGEAEGFFQDAAGLHPSSRNIACLHIEALIQQGRNHEALGKIADALVEFGVDDGLLRTALDLREKTGPRIPGRDSGKATLSLCMIVKNEEEHIARCLGSVSAIADEMIVVDTGSIDRTREIARVFGARVSDFTWADDFSAARNLSLEQASGDWILVLDADETIAPADHRRLAELINGPHAKPVAYDIVTRTYTMHLNIDGWNANDGTYDREEAGNGWYPSAKVRLFRRILQARFVNPVHECLEPSLIAAGIEIRPCPIVVHHYGRLGNEEKIQAKREAYYLLGKRKLAEQGDDPKVYYELAIAAGELAKHEEAVGLWNRFIQADPNVPSAFVNLGTVYMKLGRYAEALEILKKALKLDPDSKEAAVNYASCLIYFGDVHGVETLLEKVLRRVPDYIPANCLLATAYCLNGSLDQAAVCLDRIRAKGFDTAFYLCDQSRSFITLGRMQEASVLMEAAVKLGHDSPEMHRLLEG